MTKLVCLHFSDLHWGHALLPTLWPDVRTKLKQDVSRLLQGDKVDLVLFTGDLTNTGTEPEFGGFQDWLDKIWKELDLGDAKLLAIPGNHDLQRANSHLLALANCIARNFGVGFAFWADSDLLAITATWKRIREKFWNEPIDSYRRYVTERFHNYQAWWKTCPQRHESAHGGLLPGDFAATVVKDGVKFGFFGLNSAFRHISKGNFERRLDFDVRQFHEACKPDGPEWADGCQFRVLLTHHPLSWFIPQRAEAFEHEILSYFHCYLFGHMHEFKGQSERVGGLTRTHKIQAASLCGLEKYGNKDERRHGYALIVFEADSSGALRYEVRPRRLEKKQGAWSFDRESGFLETNHDSYEEALRELKTPEIAALPPVAHKPFPVPPTITRRFIGREEKRAAVIAAIQQHRLVTIKGVGGVGKSALAREVLDRHEIRQQFGEFVAWAGLDRVPVDTKDAVTGSIVEQLQLDRKAKGYALSDEDIEQRGSPIDRLVRSLAGVPALLVLDSCEGVVNSVSELCAKLHVLATDLRVLATSWKPLAVSGEKVIELEPMCVPDETVSPDAFIKVEAVRLFEQYAQLRKADFSVTDRNRQPISNILELTEGLPLAIRLTAVRVADTPLDAIVRQLRTNPLRAAPKITSSIPRHASLSLCFDWSFGLLSDDAKALFPLLSLFIAPFTYDHAIRLAQGAVHTRGILSRERAETARCELVNASFLEFDNNIERHWMLGLLRAYGQDRLAQAGIFGQAKKLFADCFCEFNGAQGPALRLSLQPPYDNENLCQAGWYALDESLSGAASKLRSAINRWLRYTGRWRERRNFNERLVALQDRHHKTGPARSWSHIGLAESLNELGEPINVVIDQYLQALEHIPKHWPKSETEAHNRDRIETEVARELSKLYARKGEMGKAFDIISDMLRDERHLVAPKFRASLHDQLGRLYLDTHQWEPAIERFEESLRLRENYTVCTERDTRHKDNEQARSWLNLGDAYQKARNHERASSAYAEAVRLWDNVRRQRPASLALSKQAITLSFAGKAPQAEAMFLEAIAQRRKDGDERGAALTEAEFAAHLERIGDLERAESCIESACAKLKDRGDWKALARSLDTAANIFILERKWPDAKQSLHESLRVREKLGDRNQVITLDQLGRLYDALGDTPNARRYFTESIKRGRLIARPLDLPRVLLSAAVMNARHGPFEEAETLLAEAIPIFETLERWDDASYARNLRQWNMELRTKGGTDWTNDEYRTAHRAIRLLGERMRAVESWDAVVCEYHLIVDEFVWTPIQAAIARNEEGSALRHVPGGVERALACHERSLQFFKSVNQAAGISDTLHKLGKVWLERAKQLGSSDDRQLRQALRQAIEFYEQSIVVKRSIDETVGVVLSLEGLAEAEEMAGDVDHSFSTLMETSKMVQPWPTSAFAQQNAECIDDFLARHPEFRHRVDQPPIASR